MSVPKGDIINPQKCQINKILKFKVKLLKFAFFTFIGGIHVLYLVSHIVDGDIELNFRKWKVDLSTRIFLRACDESMISTHLGLYFGSLNVLKCVFFLENSWKTLSLTYLNLEAKHGHNWQNRNKKVERMKKRRHEDRLAHKASSKLPHSHLMF